MLPSGDLIEFENGENDLVINLRTKPNEIENSIQVFILISISIMENVIVEEIWGVCYYFKFHHNEMICPSKQFSCLCALFKNKLIWGKNRYSN